MERNISSKAEMSELKEILRGETYDPYVTFTNSQKRWSCREVAHLISGPKSGDMSKNAHNKMHATLSKHHKVSRHPSHKLHHHIWQEIWGMS